MAEPSSHINYSFEDIQRYLQGKMPAAEMHELEKAALADPFLADAIEGFNEVDFTIAKQHLNEINAGLFAEKQQNKIVAFNKRTQWLNAAAVIIVLAAIGLVASYFLNKPSNQQSAIAKLKQEEANNKTTKDSISFIANSNTSSRQTDTALFIAQNKPVTKTKAPLIKTKTGNKIITADNNAINQVVADSFKAGIVSAAQPSALSEKTMMSRSYNADAVNSDSTQVTLREIAPGISVLPSTFSGKVVDENNKPIAGVTIVSDDKQTAVLTDINGDFNLQKKDTLLKVTASTVGYDSRTLALKQGINDTIMLKESNAALNDVVVVGYGTSKKNAYTDSIKRSQRKENSDSAMPVGGWNNFNNYVITQLNKDTTTSSITNLKDLVELEFLIDKAGNPYDIKVVKSPNDQYSNKAVEILKNGPKWTNPSRKKKAKLVLNF